MRSPGQNSQAAEETKIKPLKILVVDDANTNVMILRALLEGQGHKVVTAGDGLEAISAFLHENPDLILMDVIMPNMDGIEAARHIRDINEIIPIFFLSAANDASLIEQALEIGSDYITKPVSLPQLNKKLNAHFRAVLAYQEVVAKKNEVQQLHGMLLEENQVAAHVLARMLDRMLPPGNSVQYTVIPSGIFSGDIVLAGRTPSGRLNVMLADAIGHGLPAAFSLMPLIPAFDAMTRKGFPLEDILFEINRTLRTVMPVGRFVAATAVSVDPQTGLCDVWIGGNPPVAVLSRGSLRYVPSSHLALGLAGLDDKAEFVCESLRLETDDRLIFWSDGLIEAWDSLIKESAGNLEAFIVNCDPTEVFDRLMAQVKRYSRHDDTSLAVLRMGQPECAEESDREPVAPHGHARLELDLEAAQLKNPDILHDIVDMVHKTGLVAPTDGLFGMVLTELFANALEHGVLGLASEIKYAHEDGLETFMQLKEQRLAALQRGHIKVEIEATEFSGKPATRLRIVDSGPGFEQTTLLADGDFADAATAGRGFKLVVNVCLKVSYAGTGNDVTAYIPIPC